jgi:hypothetical protein
MPKFELMYVPGPTKLRSFTLWDMNDKARMGLVTMEMLLL